MMSVLISPKELHEQLDRVVVLDARGFDAYAAAHIPGSLARHGCLSTTVERMRCDHGFSHRGV